VRSLPSAIQPLRWALSFLLYEENGVSRMGVGFQNLMKRSSPGNPITLLQLLGSLTPPSFAAAWQSIEQIGLQGMTVEGEAEGGRAHVGG